MDDNKINVRIPDGTGYGLSDIENRAKELGLNKSEFIMKAVDMMMNFDEEFYKKVQTYSKAAQIPEWLVIQNLIIERMAYRAAKVEADTLTGEDRVLVKVLTVPEGNSFRTATAEEYFNALKRDFFIKEQSQCKKEGE